MFSIKIDGLDRLQKRLSDLENATQALGKEIAVLTIDLRDPQSVESELRRMHAEIDRRMAPFASDKLVRDIAIKLKEELEAQVRARVARAQARSKDAGDFLSGAHPS